MDRLVEAVAADLRRTAAVGGEDTARVADLLIGGLGPSLRLHLLETLGEVARDLEASAPGARVRVRLEGADPVLELVPAPAAGEQPPGPAGAGSGDGFASYLEDELMRMTVRLPEGLKSRVEQSAAGAGASINSWIVAAVARSLEGQAGAGPAPGKRMPRRISGFVQG
ncbi:hypothetical protein GHK86_21365 [Acidimicrobiaceae bacterium USS-CC1]|uniref:Toxin-antitoxin system HicB family antitoxin n=1 Tax=Acidiferrimicrobium australe TaxID=2664430 RepID=A0ABW9QZI3_9ACTN|nr:hypothetical protein [Acidiferrimicrobium australe]